MYSILFVLSVIAISVYTFFEMAYLLSSKVEFMHRKRITSFLRKPERVIITVLVGTNLFSVAASMFYRKSVGLHNGSGAIIEGGLLVTLILFVFGEMIPKNAAIILYNRLFGVFSPAIWGTYIVFAPLITVVEWITGIFYKKGMGRQLKEEENDALAYISEVRKQLSAEEIESSLDVIEEIVRFMDASVLEYAIPLMEVNVMYKDNVDFELARKNIFTIIYDKGIDDIVGILKPKYIYLIEKGYITLEESLTEPVFVHETQNVKNVLSVLRDSDKKEAIVVDEHGVIKGVFSVHVLKDVILRVSRGHFFTLWGSDKLERLARLCGKVNTNIMQKTLQEFLVENLEGDLRPGRIIHIGVCKLTIISMRDGMVGRVIVQKQGEEDESRL